MPEPRTLDELLAYVRTRIAETDVDLRDVAWSYDTRDPWWRDSERHGMALAFYEMARYLKKLIALAQRERPWWTPGVRLQPGDIVTLPDGNKAVVLRVLEPGEGSENPLEEHHEVEAEEDHRVDGGAATRGITGRD
jgi:hypothetical protein